MATVLVEEALRAHAGPQARLLKTIWLLRAFAGANRKGETARGMSTLAAAAMLASSAGQSSATTKSAPERRAAHCVLFKATDQWRRLRQHRRMGYCSAHYTKNLVSKLDCPLLRHNHHFWRKQRLPKPGLAQPSCSSREVVQLQLYRVYHSDSVLL